MTVYEDAASGVSQYKGIMDVTVSGSTVTVTAAWERDSYGYSSFSDHATWTITIDGTTWTDTWNFSGPAGGSISRKNLATRSKNVGYQGNTSVYVKVDFDVSPGVASISKTVSVATTPSAPGMPAVTAITADGKATVSWSAPASNGAGIDDYQVQWDDNSSFSSPSSYQPHSGGTRSYTASGLSNGKTWYFRVRAHNSKGWGGWSSARSLYAANTPATSGPSLAFVAPSTLNASWPAASADGRTVLEYEIRWDDDPAFGSPTTVSTGTTLSYSITGLPAGSTNVQVRARSDRGWGPWSSTASYTVPSVPSAPGVPQPSNLSPTAATLSWSAPADGGAPITGYDVQWNTAQSETGATTQTQGATTTKIVSPLNPGTGYFARVRAKNSQGDGAWSPWVSFTTLPSSPPGISVLAAASGRSATVTLTPPGGVSGVTSYSIERRVGTGAATTFSTPTTTYNATGLTPGTAYQWRASAFIGGYQSPWSDWVTVTQPRPNTSPGDYFDGASAATPDVTYSFTGTANNSTSLATGQKVLGWQASGNALVMYRITGGLYGSFSAACQFTKDQSSGWFANTVSDYAADVVPGASYTVSAWVSASVPVTLTPIIGWLDASRAYESGTGVNGATVTITPDDGWVRLSASAVCPDGKVFAFLALAPGSSSTIPAGALILLDGAMCTLGPLVEYFDGDSTDTPDVDNQWLGTPNNSVSIQVPLVRDVVDPLADPDCAAPPAPPLPPTVDSSCIDEVGMWRRYFVGIAADQVTQWASTMPTIVLTTGSNAERQIRLRIYPNPDNLPDDQVDVSTWDSETIISYMPANTEMTLDSVSERAWASVDGGDAVAANRLLYGTGGTPPTWPTLRCGVGYLLTLDTPLEAPAGNLSTEVYLTDRVM